MFVTLRVGECIVCALLRHVLKTFFYLLLLCDKMCQDKYNRKWCRNGLLCPSGIFFIQNVFVMHKYYSTFTCDVCMIRSGVMLIIYLYFGSNNITVHHYYPILFLPILYLSCIKPSNANIFFGLGIFIGMKPFYIDNKKSRKILCLGMFTLKSNVNQCRKEWRINYHLTNRY